MNLSFKDDDRYIELRKLAKLSPDVVDDIFQHQKNVIRYEKNDGLWSIRNMGRNCAVREDLEDDNVRLLIHKKDLPGSVDIDIDEGFGSEYEELKEKDADEIERIIAENSIRVKEIEDTILKDPTLSIDEDHVAPVVKSTTRIVTGMKVMGEKNKLKFNSPQQVTEFRKNFIENTYKSVSSLLSILRVRPDVKSVLGTILNWVEGKTIRHSVSVAIEYFMFLLVVNKLITEDKFWHRRVISRHSGNFEMHPYARLTARALDHDPRVMTRHQICDHGLKTFDIPSEQVWFTIGALHHDIWGKLPNPDQADFFESETPPPDRIKIEQHVLIGEMVLRQMGFPPLVVSFAGNHHFRNGHPRGYGSHHQNLIRFLRAKRAENRHFKKYQLFGRFHTYDLTEFQSYQALAYAPLSMLSYIDAFVALKERRRYRADSADKFSEEEALSILQREIVKEPLPMFDFIYHDMMVLWQRSMGTISSDFPLIAEMDGHDIEV